MPAVQVDAVELVAQNRLDDRTSAVICLLEMQGVTAGTDLDGQSYHGVYCVKGV